MDVLWTYELFQAAGAELFPAGGAAPEVAVIAVLPVHGLSEVQSADDVCGFE